MNLCTYVMWTSVFLAFLCLHSCLFLVYAACIFGLVSRAVFPEGGHDTCNASSSQRSHWCCRHACAQVQLFLDWDWQSKCIWCFMLSVTCRCEVSQVHIGVSAQLPLLVVIVIVILRVVSICVGTSVTDILSSLLDESVDCMRSFLQYV